MIYSSEMQIDNNRYALFESTNGRQYDVYIKRYNSSGGYERRLTGLSSYNDAVAWVRKNYLR